MPPFTDLPSDILLYILEITAQTTSPGTLTSLIEASIACYQLYTPRTSYFKTLALRSYANSFIGNYIIPALALLYFQRNAASIRAAIEAAIGDNDSYESLFSILQPSFFVRALAEDIVLGGKPLSDWDGWKKKIDSHDALGSSLEKLSIAELQEIIKIHRCILGLVAANEPYKDKRGSVLNHPNMMCSAYGSFLWMWIYRLTEHDGLQDIDLEVMSWCCEAAGVKMCYDVALLGGYRFCYDIAGMIIEDKEGRDHFSKIAFSGSATFFDVHVMTMMYRPKYPDIFEFYEYFYEKNPKRKLQRLGRLLKL